MKIRTIEALEDKIDEELAWRRKELLQMHALVNNENEHVSLFIRSGIAILSAHFEGFIRMAANYYVIFVSCQNVPVLKIQNGLLSLQLRPQFLSCKNTDKSSVHMGILDKLDKIASRNFSIKYSENDRIIQTHGNPSSTNIEEITKNIGLSFSALDTKRNYIDASLLKNRHEIVHGERTFLDVSDFNSTYDQINQSIDIFREMIVEAAVNKAYLKEEATTT